jgi:hypothetical protein
VVADIISELFNFSFEGFGHTILPARRGHTMVLARPIGFRFRTEL